jgi:hypothetical protein
VGWGREVASRRVRDLVGRGQRQVRGSAYHPHASKPIGTNIAHIPKEGETRSEDVPQQRLGCLGRGLSVGRCRTDQRSGGESESKCEQSFLKWDITWSGRAYRVFVVNVSEVIIGGQVDRVYHFKSTIPPPSNGTTSQCLSSQGGRRRGTKFHGLGS